MRKNPIKEHRSGYVKISREIIEKFPQAILKVNSKIIIVRAESFYMTDLIRYDCYSSLFRKVKLGEKPPEYVIEINSMGKVKAIEIK